ncbi:MAG: pyridoxamine 5'-phosphate oxidase family protein [Mangrovicoccus sp.]|nr:pyridoxamine 5'-phosphate oxidase family protein [Mangrovicoccus sp.]
MPEPKINPIRETDDEARSLAHGLLSEARFGALAVRELDSGIPHVSRIALGRDLTGQPLTLISDLAAHTRALKADPICSLLIGEPGERGDPLTHPRMTLICQAEFLPRDMEGFDALRAHYLSQYPKAQLYVDFADFNFTRLRVKRADLNGGFGKAFQLSPEDLGLS